ncbi:putative signal peptidase I (SPase I) (Leader peptidase I) [Bradyrhizobium sp. ORS 285]|uniref:signal peptidase I n=1 Tax=Bradyrhizobium sp. ORS 285 TaxID=115808 RepID=UPI0002407E93|nr:signal peptidase I [Bradyrhizobium sp. ORS 285]CCD86776.1 putative signal peptidase I (SPase I) (Leader peptidase I) [Bradyrhizobium sp. ORS 285]SMX57698.1 putative signal peptidase I (SPase I) (Leader peptidase I) [Bradyrhizobium sp. ORS 285]
MRRAVRSSLRRDRKGDIATSLDAGEIRPKREPWWAILGIFIAGFAALCLLMASPMLIRSFLYQPFNAPSGSMMPTILVGDYFFVSKYPYGYSRFTWPLSWPTGLPPSARIFGATPARGDVVAFVLPKDNATVYIKRVVGLPGDRVQMKGGVLYINDAAVPRERLEDLIGTEACGGGANVHVKRWRETLPDGASYETLDCVDNGFLDNTSVHVVQEGKLYLIGDNRDNSTDSRVLNVIGDVPIENVIGRAAMIYFSLAAGGKNQSGGFRFGRIGTVIR